MNEHKSKKRKVTSTGTEVSELGKLPPQAVDLEEAVLGAMLLEKEALATINILEPDHFYKEQNGKVFTAIRNIFKRNEPVDILTVTQELKRIGELEFVGGAYYVSQLTNRIASSANIEFHARVVIQKFLHRELIRIGVDTIKRAYEDTEDVFDVYSGAMKGLESSLNGVIQTEAKRLDDVHSDVMHKNMELALKGGQSGVPSYYSDLDRLTNGWQPADLIILAGRPSMGKTAVAINLAIRPALIARKPVLVFSLEMTKEQLVGRIQAITSDVNSSRIVKGQAKKEELIRVENSVTSVNIYGAPLYIDDCPKLTILDLRAKAKRMKQKYGIELIVIDYLQLMQGMDEGNREQEVSAISRGIKVLAKELEIPIIALSQLSRQVENRAGLAKKPQLSDLRESGAIEQDADMVIFCYRPSYYQIEQYELEGHILSDEANRELLELIVAKHRSGALGTVVLGFINETTKVTNWHWGHMRASMENDTIGQLIQKLKDEDLEKKKKDCKFVQSSDKVGVEHSKLEEKSEPVKTELREESSGDVKSGGLQNNTGFLSGEDKGF